MDNLSILTSEIADSFFKKQKVAALFLDIKGAYNNPKILIRQLIEIGVPKKIIIFIYKLISERYLTFINHPDNPTRRATRGLPQGSVLSPLLYSLYTKKVQQIIEHPVKVLELADDIVVYIGTSSNTLTQALKTLETQANRLTDCLRSRCLEISPQKCKLVIFSKNNFRSRDYYINLKDTRIFPSVNVKFLGMYLDNHLNWKTQIRHLVQVQYTFKNNKLLEGNMVGFGSRNTINYYKYIYI